jgi:hypothetical protein
MDDPSFTQIGLISINIAGIEPRSDLQFSHDRPTRLRNQPSGRAFTPRQNAIAEAGRWDEDFFCGWSAFRYRSFWSFGCSAA